MKETIESSATPTLPRWSIDELLPDREETTLLARVEDLDEAATHFEARRRELSASPSPPLVLDMVREYERLLEGATVLSAYGSLWFSTDTQSEAAITFQNRVSQILTELSNRTLFFALWWQGVDDEIAAGILDALSADADVADLAFYLENLRRLAPFRLDERSEQIVNLKDADGMSGLLKIYSMLTNAFEFHPQIDSVQKEGRGSTRDELMSFAFSPAGSDREAAYHELFRVYRTQSKVLAQVYVHRVRDWSSENVRLRGYPSPLNVRNVANDVSDPAIDALLQVVCESAPIFQRYFRRKAEWLGLEKLRRYDLYAPLAPSEEKVSFEHAVELVLGTFEDFHPRFGGAARRVFDSHHIDAEPRLGKKGGAFCATVLPQQCPWVLLNYSGRLRDVATLAHELGHAIHSILAEDHSVLTQQASLPLAETASVFGEILTTERLLKERTDPQSQRELLASAIDDMYATVARQAFFVLFERRAHDAILSGASPDDLHRIYRSTLEEQFGDSLDISGDFDLEWLGIPHIFSVPFYCYAYSFGQLLVLALYRRYLEEGESFKPGYLKLLAYGGAARPHQILWEVGVDIEDPDFWRGGFEVVASFLERLEALA